MVISSPECDCAVSVHGNEIRGCTISALVTPIYSYDTILECRGVYVDKKHRAGMAGVSLLKRLKKQAVDMGASGISLGASSGIAQQRTERLYKKLGYVRNGSDYILEV